MSTVFWLFAVCLVGCSCICRHRSQDCTVPATKPPVSRVLSSLHWLEACTKTKIHHQYVGALAKWYTGWATCTNLTQTTWSTITS